MKTWQLQEAKAKLSELIKEAMMHKPQLITLHGKPAAVVVSIERYNDMKKTRKNLVAFLRSSPLAGEGLKFERDKSLTRDVDL